MLVLTCKIGERIIIDRTIAITVVGVSRGSAKLGIEAPIDIPVDREKIHLLKNPVLLPETTKLK